MSYSGILHNSGRRFVTHIFQILKHGEATFKCILPWNVWKFFILSIFISTWILKCAMPRVLITKLQDICLLLFLKGGIIRWIPLGVVKFEIKKNHLSAIMTSPTSNKSRIQSSMYAVHHLYCLTTDLNQKHSHSCWTSTDTYQSLKCHLRFCSHYIIKMY